MNISLIVGLMIPFTGTTLGAAMVFFMKNQLNQTIEKLLLGFAAGVMIAASVWSLLIPSIDMAVEQGKRAWIPAAAGFLMGIAFLLLIDGIIPHICVDSVKFEGIRGNMKKTVMMVFAVTLHNIPEGMAVGVTFAGALLGDSALPFRIFRRVQLYPCRSKAKAFQRERRFFTGRCPDLLSLSQRCLRFFLQV